MRFEQNNFACFSKGSRSVFNKKLEDVMRKQVENLYLNYI